MASIYVAMRETFEDINHQKLSRSQLPIAGQLYHAIRDNDVARVANLLRDDIHLEGYCFAGNKTFLQLAGENGCRKICELLVRHGMDINRTTGKRCHSLLHRAVNTGNYGFASILLDLGANASPRSSNDATPLHMAARNNGEYVARKLIDCGAEIDAQDTLGRSPLRLAFEKANPCVAKLLVHKSSCVDLKDRRGVTPRMIAESRGPPYSDLLFD